MNLFDEVVAAHARIRPWVRHTPAERSAWLSDAIGGQAWLKLECWQKTGSFKLRGATNKLMSLSQGERSRGVVAASTGNHGLGVSQAAAWVDTPATVFVPEGADPGKLQAMADFGTQIRVVGDDCIISEAAAREYAAAEGRIYVSPYNDRTVAAGQGTIAVELGADLETLDAVFVSMGGGGLIGGMGAWLKQAMPDCQVVAVSPVNSAVMHHSLQAGQILEMESLPTLSDATAGGVEAGSVTFELCQQGIDRSVLVEEASIAEALRQVVGRHHILVEGAAALAVAGLLQTADDWRGARVAVVLCGANIGLEKLRGVLGSPV